MDAIGLTARHWLERLRLYSRLIRLDRPVGVLLLLWPTLTALWFAARGWPGWRLMAIFVAGTWLMRAAGCAINDVADRRFDAHVKRTAQRVVATGEVSAGEALAVAAVLAAAAAVTLIWLNAAARLAALAALPVAAAYPYFKRFFALPQAMLGIAFSLGIPMAFCAVQSKLPLAALWMLAANFFWVIAYDTEYAMVDRDDDLKLGIHSSAILFGRADVAIVALCYAVYLAAMAALAWRDAVGPGFAAGWAVAAACAGYHVWLIRRRQREACLRAFLHNQWLGLAMFAAAVAGFT
ncbi:MAG TPA: 4-hydroxybenzoate octaprenyltransferase [Burkholderiaceae bacterium]|jgi:4-hydroxybenzoate polyprenyltransferase|nr:4-hydroxybenzoate octaprenyltransferase [Burkholderiaceae bacterium]